MSPSQGRFVTGKLFPRQPHYTGDIAWLCTPQETGCRDIVVVEARFEVGKFHSFHVHPQQEEVIYVLEGEIEQWLGREKKILQRGDSVFVPRNTVHATFNDSSHDARILAILGPPQGESGIHLEDVSQQEPWKSFRPQTSTPLRRTT